MPNESGSRLKNEAQQEAQRARDALVDRKALDPVIIDVRGLSSITDYFVIAGGGSPPHLKALAAEVARRWRAEGRTHLRSTGSVESGWLVIDGLDVVVHLMTPELRARYALEDLWSDAPRLEDGHGGDSRAEEP